MQFTAEQANETFTELVRENHASLRAYIRSLGVQSAWVDDIAQEAFLVAHRRFAEFDEHEGNFGAWLRGIARRLVANEVRKHARRTRLLHGAITEALLVVDAGERDETRAAAGVALKECLQKLPERSRELLKERYENNEDSPALGRRWGWSPAAARQALLRLRLALRRCVEQQLEAEL